MKEERIFEGGADKALETVEFVHAALSCEVYYRRYSTPILMIESVSVFGQVKRNITNTPERKAAYMAYDKALSGGSYTLPKSGTRKALCDFDTNKITGE